MRFHRFDGIRPVWQADGHQPGRRSFALPGRASTWPSLVCVCLDWTERVDHAAGVVGAALAATTLQRGWVGGSRVLPPVRSAAGAYWPRGSRQERIGRAGRGRSARPRRQRTLRGRSARPRRQRTLRGRSARPRRQRTLRGRSARPRRQRTLRGRSARPRRQRTLRGRSARPRRQRANATRQIRTSLPQSRRTDGALSHRCGPSAEGLGLWTSQYPVSTLLDPESAPVGHGGGDPGQLPGPGRRHRVERDPLDLDSDRRGAARRWSARR